MLARDLAGDNALYFEYLIERIGGEDWWGDRVETMVRLLERKYYWKLPIDENWKSHVDTLRLNAMRIGGISPIYILQSEPSILEVLVALSIHVALKILYTDGSDVEERVAECFSDIFTALGFDCPVVDIDDAVDRFLSGEVKLSDPKIGRECTLWEQANYLFSNQFKIESEE